MGRKWLAAHCGKAAATELLGRKWWTTAWEKSQHKGAATATELKNSWNPVWEKALHKEGMPPTELMPYWKGAGFSSLGDCLARGPIGNCRDTWRGYKWVPCGGSYCREGAATATELESPAQLTWQLCPSCSPATMAKAVQGPGGPNGSEFKAAPAKCTQCQQAHMKQIMAAGQDDATPTELMPYWKGAGFSSLGDCLARGPIGNCRDTWRGYKWVPCGGSYCREGAATA